MNTNNICHQTIINITDDDLNDVLNNDNDVDFNKINYEIPEELNNLFEILNSNIFRLTLNDYIIGENVIDLKPAFILKYPNNHELNFSSHRIEKINENNISFDLKNKNIDEIVFTNKQYSIDTINEDEKIKFKFASENECIIIRSDGSFQTYTFQNKKIVSTFDKNWDYKLSRLFLIIERNNFNYLIITQFMITNNINLFNDYFIDNQINNEMFNNISINLLLDFNDFDFSLLTSLEQYKTLSSISKYLSETLKDKIKLNKYEVWHHFNTPFILDLSLVDVNYTTEIQEISKILLKRFNIYLPPSNKFSKFNDNNFDQFITTHTFKYNMDIKI